MKRDMDLIREILLECEASDTGMVPDGVGDKIASDDAYAYHCLLILEAGLADGFETTSVDNPKPRAVVTRLTWAGHEFLDASRDPSIWQKAKGLSGKAGAIAFPVLLKVLAELALEKMGLKAHS
jgi:Hypothetical protein (DUF2513)